MGRYYTPPKETGKEYVLATEKFYSTTIFRCERLPARWKDYTLDPIVEVAGEIHKNVHLANRVRIDPKTMNNQELVKALNERITYNTEAVRLFSEFDRLHTLLMQKIDLKGYETKRIKNIIERLMSENDKDLPEEVKEKLQVNVKMGVNEIYYETVNGTVTEKLRLTHANNENWLKTRGEAQKLISGKLTKDYSYLKSLNEKIA